MPIYTYHCTHCQKDTEKWHKIKRIPNKIRCSCGCLAKKVLSRGAVLPDCDVSWLPSACKVLQKHGEPPLQSRSEYNAYLKKNHLACTG